MRKLLVLLAVLAFAVPASAATILPLNSQAGLPYTLYPGAPVAPSPAATTVEIDRHPEWALNTATSVWISYADTGYEGASYQPYYGNLPIVRIFQSFDILNGQSGTLSLRLWADDTSKAYLNGGLIINHNPFGQGSACEANVPSCQQNRYGSYTGIVGPGHYELAFDVYQIGTGLNTTNNPFGVKWEGSVDVVPEPGSMLLLGSGLFGLAGAARRRFAKK